MTCTEFLRAIDPYLDDELSVMETLEMQRHLASCERCRRIMESEAMLHALLGSDAVEDEAPASLRRRILERVQARSFPATGARLRARHSTFFRTWVWGSVFVPPLFVVLLLPGAKGPEDLAPLAIEVAAKHFLYSERHSTALEVSTSDAFRVAGWLEPHVGLPVALPRLGRADQRLVGGRRSSIAGTPAAYLLYERAGRPVSLFITHLRAFASAGATERVVDGAELYTFALGRINLVWWEDEAEHRLYAAASQAGMNDLIDFALLCVRSAHASDRDSHLTRGRGAGTPQS